MTRLIRLFRHRKALASLAAELPNDQDLALISIVLWIASLVRVALALVDGEIFRTEATLALGCVIVIPMLWLRTRTMHTGG